MRKVQSCPRCGQHVQPEDLFCPYCGQRVDNTPSTSKGFRCKECGASNEVGMVFCTACGAPAKRQGKESSLAEVRWDVTGAAKETGSRSCPACGHKNADAGMFCDDCGMLLPVDVIESPNLEVEENKIVPAAKLAPAPVTAPTSVAPAAKTAPAPVTAPTPVVPAAKPAPAPVTAPTSVAPAAKPAPAPVTAPSPVAPAAKPAPAQTEKMPESSVASSTVDDGDWGDIVPVKKAERFKLAKPLIIGSVALAVILLLVVLVGALGGGSDYMDDVVPLSTATATSTATSAASPTVTATSTAVATEAPMLEPTAPPTVQPTETPTAQPTAVVTPEVSAEPEAGVARYAVLADSEVGSYITFGNYEQDNNIANGKEEIEWLVLAKEDNRLLVISRYALDCKYFNEQFTEVTWETCTLRAWMNDNFFNAAFSPEEQSLIPTSLVRINVNPDIQLDPGNDTLDKVFLLSYGEAATYFSSDRSRQCMPTVYARSQGAEPDDQGRCPWWLRTPGWELDGTLKKADRVYYAGEIGSSYRVRWDHVAVRPALWLDFSNLGLSAGGGNTNDSRYVVITNSNANIRSGPDVSTRRIANAAFGEAFPYLGEAGNWYIVNVNGQPGYVVKELSALQDHAEIEPTQRTTVAATPRPTATPAAAPRPTATPCSHPGFTKVEGEIKDLGNGEWEQECYKICTVCEDVIDVFYRVGGIKIEAIPSNTSTPMPKPTATPCAHSSTSEVEGEREDHGNGTWSQEIYEICNHCGAVVDTHNHGGVEIEGGIPVN